MSDDPNQGGYAGQWDDSDGTSDYNVQQFLIQQALAKVSTATLVKVMAVNGGGLAAPPTVDVRPLVKLIDGLGNASDHGTISGLPVFRMQSGAAAVILDPKVDDIGLAIFADRDISTVKKTKAAAPPGSRRRFDMADGLYIGGFANGAATTYVRVAEGEIEGSPDNGVTTIFASPGNVKMSPDSGATYMRAVPGLLTLWAINTRMLIDNTDQKVKITAINGLWVNNVRVA